MTTPAPDPAGQDVEIARLRSIIAKGRRYLKMPHDPDCPRCGGVGYIIHENGHENCRCDDPYQAALERMRREAHFKVQQDAAFELEHGHPGTTTCGPGCPPKF